MATRAFYNCTSRPRPYVGIYPVSQTREVFQFDHVPTEDDGLPYLYVIGPFNTIRGATFMANFGRSNPYCQCVADAERLSKLYE